MVMPVPDAAPVVVNVTESAGYIEPVRLVQFNPALVAVVLAVVLAFFLVCFAAGCMRKCIRLVDVEPEEEVEHHKQCGLDPDVLAALPHVEYKDLSAADKDLECPVCLVTFDANDNLRLLPPCSHVFHSECIDGWFKSHTTCPLCRACLLPKKREVDAEDRHEQAEIRVDVVEGMIIGGDTEQDSRSGPISTPVLSISKSLQERTGGAKNSTVELSDKERSIAHPFLRSFSAAGAFRPAVRVGNVLNKAEAVAFLRRSNSDLQLPHSCSYVVDSEGTQHNRNRPQGHVIDVEEFLLGLNSCECSSGHSSSPSARWCAPTAPADSSER